MYAIIDAPGHFSDHATVYAAHADREHARKQAWGLNRRNSMHKVQVICGDVAEGDKIHSRFIGNLYPTVDL